VSMLQAQDSPLFKQDSSTCKKSIEKIFFFLFTPDFCQQLSISNSLTWIASSSKYAFHKWLCIENIVKIIYIICVFFANWCDNIVKTILANTFILKMTVKIVSETKPCKSIFFPVANNTYCSFLKWPLTSWFASYVSVYVWC